MCDCNEEDAYYQEGGMRCQSDSSAATSMLHKYQCIPKIKICDGIPHCPNGIDEVSSVLKLSNEISQKNEIFQDF